MPGIGRVPCGKCKYVASSRRMLSRHATVIHSKKVYKCPLCPFITRYAANWYRHKRDLHGLTKSTTCETCGFFASTTEDLAQHRELEHPDDLQLQKYQDKYDKEREKLVIPEDKSSINNLFLTEYLPISQQNDEDDDEIKILGDSHENDILSLENLPGEPSQLSNGGLADDNAAKKSRNVLNFETPVRKNMITPEQDVCVGPMSPLKVRRSYSCESCGLLTTNPREFLYHQRDVHKIKMNVYECNHCVYASKHVQKLQRHCNLVHRPRAPKTDGYPKKVNCRLQKTDKKLDTLGSPSTVPQTNMSAFDFPSRDLSNNFQNVAPVKKKSTNPKILHCSACNYQTRNKMLLMHHEKTMHLKKKFFRCLQCGYVTSDKSIYVKHVEGHGLPKMKCEFCHFKTANKWTMERHLKNHELGGEGEYNCLLCSFVTKNKPSLKTHVTKFHEPSMSDVNDDCDEEYENDEVQIEDFNDANTEFESPELNWGENHQSNDQGFITSHNDSLMNSETFLPGDENSKIFFKRTPPKRMLKCRFCGFKAAWPFQIKKHEETHKTPKKHPCPLCGMRFEHIAWLSKHLSRVHKENTRARELAAALELLKPNRRRSPKISPEQLNSLNSSFQSILRQSDLLQGNAQQSLLSSLLKQPGIPSPSRANEHSIFIEQNTSSHLKAELSESFSEGYSPLPSLKQQPPPVSLQRSESNMRCCDECDFKTMWVSELEEHMQIHESEESFTCSKCDFHCKSKTNLNRHMITCHGMKTKNDMIPKLKLKKSLSGKLPMGNSWQSISQEVNSAPRASAQNQRDQECPLDLTMCRSTFPSLAETITLVSDEEDMEVIDLSLENNEPDVLVQAAPSRSLPNLMDNTPFIPYNSYYNSDESNNMSLGEGSLEHKFSQRRYQCPFCTFNTSTPSRFHVHIVQHYNKRPFMCSECGYRSNYEWDITKHIRIKACKEKTHHNACVLLTDETGRRNYNKYDKYIMIVPLAKKATPLSRINDMVNSKELNDLSTRNAFGKELQPDGMYRKASFDGNQPNSNIEGAPVSIVVTPDIDMSFSQELAENFSPIMEPLNDEQENSPVKKDELPVFYCKHCDYKHTSKRLVISHLGTHAGVKPFHCLLCGYSSNWRNNAVKHVKASHNGSVADVENRISYSQEGRVVYLTSVKTGDKQLSFSEHQTSQFGCKLCPYKCDKEFYINFHMKQHKPREGARFKCEFCPYYVKFKKTLVRHMKLHSENVQPPSPSAVNDFKEDNQNAPSEFNVTEDFNETNQNYFAVDNYLSVGDQETFTEPQQNCADEESISINYEQLQASTEDFYESEVKSKRHICEHCPYNTDNKTQYLYHKQFHRPNAAAPFKCSICSYWATMQHLITQHMKVHRDDNPEVHYESKSSNARWDSFDIAKKRSNSSLADQVQIVYVQRENFSGKMFKCKYCPMMNKKRANVRVHQRMHLTTSNDGKFGCNICNYKCLNQGGLTNHMKIHQADEAGINCQMDSIYETSQASNSTSPSLDFVAKRKKIFSYFCMRCPAVFKSSSDLNTHKYFHGSSLPFSCTHCDYSAKHKPHLYKHLQVHTPEYIAKRDASAPPSVLLEQMESADCMDFSSSTDKDIELIDPLLLQEAAEVRSFLKKGKNAARKMHKCDICPSAFYEITTLSFHTSLHGSHGEYGCSQCNYSTVRSANLAAHIQVHSRVLHDGKFIRIFSCPKCPATFKKRSRHEKHLSLHGRNFPFVCEHCDYSVRFAANLCKHKLVHMAPKASNHKASPAKVDVGICTDHESFNLSNVTTPPNKVQKDSVKVPESNEEKKIYICERCPYYQSRKDAVVNHLRRHSSNERYKCPFCDYSSFQAFFLRDHIRSHVQPSQLFTPQGFMRYKNFQVWCVDEDNKKLVFEDKDSNLKNEERFYPPYVRTEHSDVNKATNSTDEFEEDYTLSNEEKRSAMTARIFEEICAKVFKTAPNGNKLSPHVEDEPIESNSIPANDSTSFYLIKDLKIELIDIIAERKRLDKLVSSTDLVLINKFLKKWRKAKQNRMKKHRSSKFSPSIKCVKPKLTVNKACNEDGSQKSGLVVKIKVENVEKLKEGSVFLDIDDNLDYDSDAASDVTIPADDLENLTLEVRHEESSIADNVIAVKLNECSVTVKPLSSDVEQQSEFCGTSNFELQETDNMEIDLNNSNSLSQLKKQSVCSLMDTPPMLNGCHNSIQQNEELVLEVSM